MAAGGRLDGVTYQGLLDLSANSSLLYVKDGFTGGAGGATISLTGGGSELRAEGSETIDNAIINIGNNDGNWSGLENYDLSGAGTLTLGPNLTINQVGLYALLTTSDYGLSGSGIVNKGTINANLSGGDFIIQAYRYAFGDGGGSFTNLGTINVANGDTLTIDSNLSTGQLGTVTTTNGGILQIGGILNNTGATLVVSPGSALTLIASGSITNGTIQDTGSGLISFGGTLDGVTYQGLLDLSANSSLLYVKDGFTGGAGGATISLTGGGSELRAEGSETIDNAIINIGNNDGNWSGLENYDLSGAGTLTLGPNLTINQVGLYALLTTSDYGLSGSGIVNKGTINANLSGGDFIIQAYRYAFGDGGGSFTNLGTINVANGDNLTISAVNFSNEGEVELAGGTLDIEAALSGAGSISLSTGSTLNLGSATSGAPISVSSSNSVVNVNASGDVVTIAGTGNTVNVGGGNDVLTLTGGGNTVTLSASNTSLMLTDPGDTVNISGTSDTVTLTVSDDTVNVSGASNSITINGDSNTVDVSGANDTAVLVGASETVNVSGGGASISLNGAGDVVNVTAAGPIQGSGNGISIVENGIGDVVVNASSAIIGLSGDGILLQEGANGFGNLVANVSGSVAGTGNGIAGLWVQNLNQANTGNVTVTATGATVSSTQYGIRALTAGSGKISATIDANSTINSGGTGVSVINFDTAIDPSAGSMIIVTASGTISSGSTLNLNGSTPKGIDVGYYGAASGASTVNPNVNGSVLVNSSAQITAAGYGINAYNYGNGDVTVNDTGGSINAGAIGIAAYAESTGTGNVAINVASQATIGTTGVTAGTGAILGLSTNTGVSGGTPVANSANVSIISAGTINSTGSGIVAVDKSSTVSPVADSSILVTNSGAITSGTVLTGSNNQPAGILAGYLGGTAPPASGAWPVSGVFGNVTVNNSADITAAAGDGIRAYNYGTGDVTVNDSSGTIKASLNNPSPVNGSGIGISAYNYGPGNITVMTGVGTTIDAQSSGIFAINEASVAPAASSISVTAYGAINPGFVQTANLSPAAGILAGFPSQRGCESRPQCSGKRFYHRLRADFRAGRQRWHQRLQLRDWEYPDHGRARRHDKRWTFRRCRKRERWRQCTDHQ